MKSGSFSSYRAALSGTGADIGGERDDPPEQPSPQLSTEELTERFYLVREQRNKLLLASQKALAAFDAALLSNGVGSTWSGKDVDEMKAAVALCSPGETNADLEEINPDDLLKMGFTGGNDEPDVDVYDRQAGVGTGGPIVRVVIRWSRSEQVASHLMLCWKHQCLAPGKGSTSLSFEISDYPTRGEIMRLCESLGIEFAPPGAPR